MLRVLGNSHVRYFLGHDPVAVHRWAASPDGFATTYQAGHSGATIWGLRNKDSSTGAGEKLAEVCASGELGDDHVVMVLGDVDLKRHLVKRDDPFSGVPEIIDLYEDFLVKHVTPYCRSGLSLFGGVPPSRANLRLDEMSGIRGSPEKLPELVRCFDRALERMAAKHEGWRLIDPLWSLAGPDGFVSDDLMNTREAPNETHIRYEITLGSVRTWLERHPLPR
jgi:hypothetical protein